MSCPSIIAPGALALVDRHPAVLATNRVVGHVDLAAEGLRRVGVKMAVDQPAKAEGDKPRALEGKTLVVTGTLQKYKREEIKELIEQHGGRASSSISKSTDYLVAGENAGSKLDKAKNIKTIKILNEEEFLKMVET